MRWGAGMGSCTSDSVASDLSTEQMPSRGRLGPMCQSGRPPPLGPRIFQRDSLRDRPRKVSS